MPGFPINGRHRFCALLGELLGTIEQVVERRLQTIGKSWPREALVKITGDPLA